MYTREEVINRFTYHTPTPIQIERMAQIRAAAMNLALAIFDNSSGSDRTGAIRKVHEAQMTANAGIMLE